LLAAPLATVVTGLVDTIPGLFIFSRLDLVGASKPVVRAGVVVDLEGAAFPRFQTLVTNFFAEAKNPKREGLGFGAK
jgi:hypothetical protein